MRHAALPQIVQPASFGAPLHFVTFVCCKSVSLAEGLPTIGKFLTDAQIQEIARRARLVRGDVKAFVPGTWDNLIATSIRWNDTTESG